MIWESCSKEITLCKDFKELKTLSVFQARPWDRRKTAMLYSRTNMWLRESSGGEKQKRETVSDWEAMVRTSVPGEKGRGGWEMVF